MTMDFPSGEIAGLETATIFCTSPSSNFRAWASARSSAAMARSNGRIPRSNFPANGTEFLVFVGMTVSPRLRVRREFRLKGVSGIRDWDLRLGHHTLRLPV